MDCPDRDGAPACVPGASPGGAGGTGAWTFVVPVRDARGAKTRLDTPPGVDRAALVRAMALDTVAALTGAGARVTLVTGDGLLPLLLAGAPVRVVADPGGVAGGGSPARLAGAIMAGLSTIPAQEPAAVALADLPALRPADVEAVLGAALAQGAVFVRDADGTGTTILAATRREALRPAFGPGSAREHALVAAEAGFSLPRARRDVDTAADLADALRLGTGRHTTRLLAGRDVPGRD